MINRADVVHDQNAFPSVEAENAFLRDEVEKLRQRIAWFEKQLFGRRSERRIIEHAQQLNLLGEATHTPPAIEDKLTITYQRGTAKKQRAEDCVTDSGLRFNEGVPVEVIHVTPPELSGAEADQHQIIDTQVTHKLAQRPASYVVLRYEIPVLKHKDQPTLITPSMPDAVLDNSLADVSVLAGLLVDKFLYHLPLYRQHQRLAHTGITLSRATLTNWVKRTIELLRPVVEAQLRHILLSKTLAMDETGIKAGRAGPGKLKQGYFWPVYGEDDEVVFTYAEGRGRRHIEQILSTQFQGTLLSDGYAAYARYVAKTQGITHAQCWVHTRRYFVEAQQSDPPAVAQILELIGELYRIEAQIQQHNLHGDKKQRYRTEHSKPIVDQIFEWSGQQCRRHELTPQHPLTKALNYLRHREPELRVFLEDPDVPLDTNHLERQIRPIPLGRKNWLFCWTELGAEHVGLVQSLISTCKLHGVNVHTYLTDVLQRISVHPASRIEELTPRLWKENFADNPMRSVLDRHVNYGSE